MLLKKGISTMISAVLIIAITVTVAILVNTWASGVTSTAQSSITNKSKEITGCASAAIEIESVYILGTTNANATAVVKNSGLVNDLQIVAAQLYLANGTNTSAQSLPITNVDRGNIVTLSFRNIAIGTSCSGNFSKIVVETTCPGAADTFDVQSKVPNCA